VLAISILHKLYPQAQIVRTRELSVLETCDIVVDVAGGKYDHHIVNNEVRNNNIPYAAAGLVWRDFGPQIAHAHEIEFIDRFVTSIDEKLIQAIDALDNGYQLDKDIRIKGISDLISDFNPLDSHEDEDEAFLTAVDFASRILDIQIKKEVHRHHQVDERTIVEEAYNNRYQKEVMILNEACPWREPLLEIDQNEEVLFVIFPEKSGEYRIQVVPKEAGKFEARKDLPEEWAGKRDQELGEIIGIDDAVFCHAARFIAGAKSKESVLKMAQLAL
jgi:uncharacterized UPF0160 family protein